MFRFSLLLLQVMGLQISQMSSTSKDQNLSLPKLRGDSCNWATYSERILNYLTSKCQWFHWHVKGTARKLEQLIEHDGNLYRSGSLAPLTDEEIEKHEETTDSYDQMQQLSVKLFTGPLTKPPSFKSRTRLTLHLCGEKLHQFMPTRGVFTRLTSWHNFKTSAIPRKKVWGMLIGVPRRDERIPQYVIKTCIT